jgi:hypothetical protein
MLSDPAQIENRIKLYVATASYELTHGSSGTRSSGTGARGDPKTDASKLNAAVSPGTLDTADME